MTYLDNAFPMDMWLNWCSRMLRLHDWWVKDWRAEVSWGKVSSVKDCWVKVCWTKDYWVKVWWADACWVKVSCDKVDWDKVAEIKFTLKFGQCQWKFAHLNFAEMRLAELSKVCRFAATEVSEIFNEFPRQNNCWNQWKISEPSVCFKFSLSN